MTYTPESLLRLYIIEPGSEDDTWGELLNANFQRLAQSGHGRVVKQFQPSDTTYTLNDTDFTGTESHKAVIYLYGTMANNIEVVLPEREHLWNIFCDTVPQNAADPKTVTVRANAAAQKVILKHLDRAIVHCDGQNVLLLYRKSDTVLTSGENKMLAPLDMNQQKIINVPAADAIDGQAASSWWVAAHVNSIVNAAIMTVKQQIFPVGGPPYFTLVNINPVFLLGFGSWVPWGGGTFLALAGPHTDTRGEARDLQPGEKQPGEYQHQLQHAEMPRTDIVVATRNPTDHSGGFSFLEATSAGSGGSTLIASFGGNVAANNLPPFSVLYAWRRVT